MPAFPPAPSARPAGDTAAMPAALRFHTALMAGSSITLAFFLAYALHVERPYWAGVAAMVLSQSAQGQSLQKGLWRMAATVVGAAAGMALLASFGESRAALLAAYGGLLAVLVMLMRGSSYSYFYYSTALMAVLVGAQSHEEAPFSIAVARMEENLVGIAAYTLCALCLRPQSASREIGRLPDFGRGVLDELAASFAPAILRDKGIAALQALAALALVTALWQWLYPPGTESALFVEIAALLVLLGFMSGGAGARAGTGGGARARAGAGKEPPADTGGDAGRETPAGAGTPAGTGGGAGAGFDPRALPASFAAGVAAALIFYGILPALPGFAALGALIFAFSFCMAWALPRPEQGMARMGICLPVFVLSGMGGEHFSPQGLVSGAAGLMSAALTVAAVFMLAGAGREVPPENQREGRRSVAVPAGDSGAVLPACPAGEPVPEAEAETKTAAEKEGAHAS